VIYITVQADIEKLIALCEATMGNYSLMAQSTEEQNSKDTYNNMKSDIQRHIQFLNDRLEYLNENNQLNKK